MQGNFRTRIAFPDNTILLPSAAHTLVILQDGDTLHQRRQSAALLRRKSILLQKVARQAEGLRGGSPRGGKRDDARSPEIAISRLLPGSLSAKMSVTLNGNVTHLRDS